MRASDKGVMRKALRVDVRPIMAGVSRNGKPGGRTQPGTPSVVTGWSASSRSASVRITAMAKNGVSCTRKRKLFSVMGATSQAVLARAVAARGDPSIRAISPKMPPCDSFSTTLPSRSISTSPERITYILSPLSPSAKMTSPGLKRGGRKACIGQKLEIDRRHRHARLLLARLTGACRYSMTVL